MSIIYQHTEVIYKTDTFYIHKDLKSITFRFSNLFCLISCKSIEVYVWCLGTLYKQNQLVIKMAEFTWPVAMMD